MAVSCWRVLAESTASNAAVRASEAACSASARSTSRVVAGSIDSASRASSRSQAAISASAFTISSRTASASRVAACSPASRIRNSPTNRIVSPTALSSSEVVASLACAVVIVRSARSTVSTAASRLPTSAVAVAKAPSACWLSSSARASSEPVLIPPSLRKIAAWRATISRAALASSDDSSTPPPPSRPSRSRSCSAGFSELAWLTGSWPEVPCQTQRWDHCIFSRLSTVRLPMFSARSRSWILVSASSPRSVRPPAATPPPPATPPAATPAAGPSSVSIVVEAAAFPANTFVIV